PRPLWPLRLRFAPRPRECLVCAPAALKVDQQEPGAAWAAPELRAEVQRARLPAPGPAERSADVLKSRFRSVSLGRRTAWYPVAPQPERHRVPLRDRPRLASLSGRGFPAGCLYFSERSQDGAEGPAVRRMSARPLRAQ